MSDLEESDNALPLLPIQREECSYLYGRDPSILAYSQRPPITASTKINLEALYETATDESTVATTTDTIKVYLRMKPLAQKKLSESTLEAYKIISPTTLQTRLPSVESMNAKRQSAMVCRKYTFTQTFGPETSQLLLFEEAVKPHMIEFLAGKNSVVMAYGTTNSGKSYTLQGNSRSPGLIPRGLEFVFSNIIPSSSLCFKPVHHSDVVYLDASARTAELETKTNLLAFTLNGKNKYINTYKEMQSTLQSETSYHVIKECDACYLVWVSFAEIYNETIYDLLSNDCQKRRPLKLSSDSQGRLYIKDLKMINVQSGDEAYQVLMAGQYNLKIAATAMNSRSSRSHCIFTIKLMKYHSGDEPENVSVSTFTFCDLAGSERLTKTLNVGDRLKEAQNINTSLLVLSRCLKSMYEYQTNRAVKAKTSEVVGPFRESKLTRLFQGALSGKEHIILIVNINAGPSLYIETQNVLKFSAIAKKIVIEPKKPIIRKPLRGRFSQAVTQSMKTATDWDTVDMDNIEETEEEKEDSEGSLFIDEDEYIAIIEENKQLKQEILEMKFAALEKEQEIRTELSNQFKQKLHQRDEDYQKHIQDLEKNQEVYGEWKQQIIENHYLDQIMELKGQKRRRSDTGDLGEEETKLNIEELEEENSELLSKLEKLQEKYRHLKEANKECMADKNKAEFHAVFLESELQKKNKLLEEADFGNDDLFIEELENQLAAEKECSAKLRRLLDEAKEEYIDMQKSEELLITKVQQQEIIYQENCEKILDLEEQLDCAEIISSESGKTIEKLEHNLELKNQELSILRQKMESQNRQLQDISKVKDSALLRLEKVAEDYKKEHYAAQNKRSALEQEVVSLKDELEQTKSTLAWLKIEIKAAVPLQTQDKAVVAEISCQTETLAGIEKMMQTSLVEEEIVKTQEYISMVEQKDIEKQQILDKKHKAEETTSKMIENLKDQISNLKKQFAVVESKAKAYEEDINKKFENNAKSSLRELAKTKEQLEKSENIRQEIQESYNVRINDLEKSKEVLEKQIELMEKNAKAMSEMKEKSQQKVLKDKDAEIEQIKKNRDDTFMRYETLFDSLNNEKANLMKEISRLKDELQTKALSLPAKQPRKPRATVKENETPEDSEEELPLEKRSQKKTSLTDLTSEEGSQSGRRTNNRRGVRTKQEMKSEDEAGSETKKQTRRPTRRGKNPACHSEDDKPKTRRNARRHLEISPTSSKAFSDNGTPSTESNKSSLFLQPTTTEVKRTVRRPLLYDDGEIHNVETPPKGDPSPSKEAMRLRSARRKK